MTDSRFEKRFDSATTSTIGLSHFLHDIYTAFLAPLLPFLIEKHGLSYAMSGILVMLMRAPSILNPAIGGLSDKFGLKFFVIVSPALTAMAMGFVPMAPDYIFLCVLLLIAGTSSAAFHVPAPVIIREFSADKVGRGMSFFMVGGELARTVGPLIILFSLSVLKPEGTPLVALLGIAASVLIFYRLKDVKVHSPVNRNGILKGFRDILKVHGRLLFIIGGIVLSKSFLLLALTSFLPTFLTSRGSDLWFAGISLSVLELAGAAGAMTSGTLSDKFGRKNMLLLMTLAAPIVLVLFINADGWLLFPMLILLGFMAFSASPVMMALVLEQKTDMPASLNSIYMTLNFFVGSAVAGLFGVLGDVIDLENTYYISAALTMLGLVFVLLLPKEERAEKT